MDSERTPSEAVRVAVQALDDLKIEAKQFARAAVESALSRPSDRVSDPSKLLLECFKRIDALAALSLHVGDAPTTDLIPKTPEELAEWRRGAASDMNRMGASASPTALCGLRPEPQSVSALRAPIPGAEPVAWAIYDSQGYYTTLDIEDQARHFCATYNRRKADDPLKPYTYRPLYTSPPPGAHDMTREVCSLALAVLGSVHPEGTDPYVMEAERRIRAIESRVARGIDSGEAGETRSGSTPKGQEPGAREGTRPEEIAQPSLHIEPETRNDD